MRVLFVLLITASLSACHRTAEQPAAKAVPAALNFDGASGDRAAVLAHGERLSHVLGCRASRPRYHPPIQESASCSATARSPRKVRK